MESMKKLRQAATPLTPRLRKILRKEGVLRVPNRKRGCGGGKTIVHNIRTVVGRRPDQNKPQMFWIIKVTIQNNRPTDHAMLTTFLMTNPRSLVYKIGELQSVLIQNHVDVAAISETWFSSHKPEELLGIDGYTLFSKCRSTRRGGGIALYIRDCVPCYPLTCIKVPQHLECFWVKVRPPRLPRNISAIAVCVVYSPPKSPHEDELIDHLIASADLLRTKYPDIGLVILGDLNHLDIRDICLDNKLCQVVENNTRGEAILDKIITNMKPMYLKPEILPALASSDHNCVLWSPKAQSCPPQCIKRVVQPIREPGLKNGRRLLLSLYQSHPHATKSRQNHSTTHNLVSLMDFMYRTSDVSGSVCTVITTDFAKAFDAVDHTVAVQCLLDLGVRPSLIPWICSFMTDRQQKVRYLGHLFDWEYPTCGVAQGTVLGPIVFLALINSALQDGPHHWKYVDDMTIAQSWSPKVPCTLQQTLNGLDTWVNEHKMKLNPSKCKVVHVTGMRQKKLPYQHCP
ncbi:hypothetical protein Bbelb_101520 [Xyrichtys novacula]|uniref:Reverse transcriptase domain-containing protein n=1 Tax=Xyrichtys novacula TaxID=13765 RepID=A0AAV1FK39_XYRNO|nr:hypothetical protein Bbelb_101520 [Xyrichtys novacula]